MPYSDDQVARVCHEAVRVLQVLHDDEVPSQPWDCEDAELRESAIDGVRRVRSGCTPRELHENWVHFKVSRGWTYGPVKDVQARTHPCLRPYDDLPESQRAKDRVFLMIVTALSLPQ